MPSWRSVLRRSLCRRLIVVGALFAYFAATIGLPLAPPVVIKDGGKPFPCQGRACGCRTAEECWRHCCCFTAAERWAWAKEHHVQPPAYAEKPAPPPKAVPVSNLLCSTAAAALLSSRNKTVTAAAHQDSCAAAGEDQSSTCPCCRENGCSAPRRATNSAPRPTTHVWGLTIAPLRCQGLATSWITTGTIPAEPPTLAPRPEPAATGRLLSPDVIARRITQVPPSRPPRLFFFV